MFAQEVRLVIHAQQETAHRVARRPAERALTGAQVVQDVCRERAEVTPVVERREDLRADARPAVLPPAELVFGLSLLEDLLTTGFEFPVVVGLVEVHE
jgi:hypothetical protein